jgi:putative phosphonate metabolism protein
MPEHDPDRRPDGTLKPLSEQAPRASAARAAASAVAGPSFEGTSIKQAVFDTGGFKSAGGVISAELVAAANAAYPDAPVARPVEPEPAYRYAIYLAPEPGSAWWKAGSSWLGRDAATGDILSQPLIAGVSMSKQQSLTAAPRRYGWHATLKAPFALADDADFVMLQGRLGAMSRERQPFPITLRVALLDDFLALIPEGDTREIDALARVCVSHLHALAAPLSPAELARRRASDLTPEQDTLLQRWGYPYVMDHFRLHFSLSGSLRNVDPDTIEALRDAAEQWFAPLPPLRVDALSLFVEPVKGADFLFTERMELGE